jgi:hypothetical protein
MYTQNQNIGKPGITFIRYTQNQKIGKPGIMFIRYTQNQKIGKPGITFIRYTQNQKIEKLNNLKFWEQITDCKLPELPVVILLL